MNKGFEIKCLDKGYVQYDGHYGSDADIPKIARVSTGSENKGDEQDKKLLGYLYRNSHCYHPEMEVLTTEGWKKWKNCQEFENYLIPNPQDKTLKTEKLKLLKFYVQNEIMEGFKNERMSYFVTPNHKMWFRTKQNFRLKNHKFEFFDADKIHNWGHFECGANYSIGDNSKKCDYFKLIGFYLGDGFLRSKNQIAFRLVRERKIKYLENILNRLNIPFKKNKKGLTTADNQVYEFIFEKSYFSKAEVYIDVNKKAKDKFFKVNELINLTIEEKAGLLDGLINSDGSIKKDREQIEFGSTSLALCQLVEALASFFNYDCHFVKKFHCYHVKLYGFKSRTSLEARKQYFYQQEYSGEVFCTTSSTGLLMVRGASEDYSFICGNSSPFEFCNITYKLKLPLFVRDQIVRHRTMKFNIHSFRYSEPDEEFYIPEVWRKQDVKNRQGSIEDTNFDSVKVDGYFYTPTEALQRHNQLSYETYQGLIKSGVARELARMVLGTNIYTAMYINVDLNNLMKFFRLRLHEHAQYEVREYAKAMFEIFKQVYPWCAEIYSKYKMEIKEIE